MKAVAGLDKYGRVKAAARDEPGDAAADLDLRPA
jgi:hypothetical protein